MLVTPKSRQKIEPTWPEPEAKGGIVPRRFGLVPTLAYPELLTKGFAEFFPTCLSISSLKSCTALSCGLNVYGSLGVLKRGEVRLCMFSCACGPSPAGNVLASEITPRIVHESVHVSR